MERAGNDEATPNQERKGLGTPATRAATIEKLIKTNLAERSNKSVIASEKGSALASVLPNALTSPELTSEWEHKLMQVEKGELSEKEFMNNIIEFISTIVKENKAPNLELAKLFKDIDERPEPLGQCPRCNSTVRETDKGFFCDENNCGFKLWKNSKFWTAKKTPLTAKIVTNLLKHGKTTIKGLHSEKTGKTYTATVILDDSGGKFVNFKLKFK